MTHPFVVVGESLIDIVQPAVGEPAEAVGGSPMNVAVGLARLDVATMLITELGDDQHGRAVRDHVAASGVHLSEHRGRRTSTATARLDSRHGASYDFDLTWDLPRQHLPAEPAGLHVGSLGASLRPGREAVLDLAVQACEAEVFVSYDPNVRPAFVSDPIEAWRDVCALAGLARLVKLSDEDLQVLRPGVPVPDLAGELLAGEATELVIVTAGGQGSTAFTEGCTVPVEAPTVDVVDTVGAGDSFMAATLALLVGWELTVVGPGALSVLSEDTLRILLGGAIAAAAVTCSRRGANPPTRLELGPGWPAS
jgi:fructokinase